jgi:hypothetical protein
MRWSVGQPSADNTQTCRPHQWTHTDRRQELFVAERQLGTQDDLPKTMPYTGAWVMHLRPFRYEPPLETVSTIRILELQPGTGQEMLQGKLRRVDLLTEEPMFSAISYVWGNPTQDRYIQSTDPVKLTQSLDIALKRLRSPYEIIHVWAD